MTKEAFRCSHRKGLRWTAAFAGGTAFMVCLLSMCYRPQTGAPPAVEVAIAPQAAHSTFCGELQGQPLTPKFAQAGKAAEVSCSTSLGRISLIERLHCEDPETTVHLASAGTATDPRLGPFLTVECGP